jgi:hypothetical protein
MVQKFDGKGKVPKMIWVIIRSRPGDMSKVFRMIHKIVNHGSPESGKT